MNPTPVTAAEAKEMFDREDGVLFVDARNPTAWGESDVKIPGAARIPVEGAEEYIDEVPRDSTVVTYCT